MTTESLTGGDLVHRPGTFQPGDARINTAGRPRKGNSFREIIGRHKVSDKKLVVETAFEKAIAGDHNWAMWLARVAGDLDPSTTTGPMREIIVREYGGWPSKIE